MKSLVVCYTQTALVDGGGMKSDSLRHINGSVTDCEFNALKRVEGKLETAVVNRAVKSIKAECTGLMLDVVVMVARVV